MKPYVLAFLSVMGVILGIYIVVKTTMFLIDHLEWVFAGIILAIPLTFAVALFNEFVKFYKGDPTAFTSPEHKDNSVEGIIRRYSD